MNILVRHELSYHYSNLVSLTPHVLHLHPPTNPYVRVNQFKLQVDPVPYKLVAGLDAENNTHHLLFYNQPADHLHITAEMQVTTLLENPFDFVFHPFEAQRLPFAYADPVKRALYPCLHADNATTLVDQFARRVAAEAGWETLPFLTHLNETIFRSFGYHQRETGPPMAPERLLIEKAGSCRDYVNLYMAACRILGIAARFVSGYYFGALKETQELHAWAEAYLPGVGWRGFDPTQNCAVADRHVPLGSSALPKLVTPVAGTFTHRGSTASQFKATVSVRPFTPAEAL